MEILEKEGKEREEKLYREIKIKEIELYSLIKELKELKIDEKDSEMEY